MPKYELLTAADPHIVEMFTNHLIAAYEQFIDGYPGTVDYIDGLMAAHNFHKAITAHLVRETGMQEWWNIAGATFEEAIARESKKERGRDERID